MRILIFALIWFIAAPAAGQGNAIASNAAVSSDQDLRVLAERIDQRSLEVERSRALNEARRAIDNEANARLENYVGLLSALIGIFGLLATILLVIIAFRTPRQAIAAAVKAASEELEVQRGRINERVDAVEGLLEEARSLVEKIRSHESAAHSILATLAPGETPLDEDQRNIVEAAAAEASAKPLAERDALDFRAVLVDDLIRKDWEALEKHAREMSQRHLASPKDLAVALFHEALANMNMGKETRANELYSDVISRFKGHDDNEVQMIVASAMLNRGVEAVNSGKLKDGISIYSEIIEDFINRPYFQRVVAKAITNKASALLSLGELHESIKLSDLVIDRWADAPNAELRRQYLRGLADKANAAGRLGRYSDSLLVASRLLEEVEKNLPEDGLYLGAAGLAAKGVALFRLGKDSEAKQIFEEMLEKYRETDDRWISSAKATVNFELACLHAQRGEVRAAVAALEAMARLKGSVECELLRSNAALNRISERPAFKSFMKRHGC